MYHMLIKMFLSRVLVAHTCNPSYSGGSRFDLLKAQGVGPEFKPFFLKKRLGVNWGAKSP
jgi:hypothetical protein